MKKQINSNFQTENLVVDWIGFKFQYLEDFTKIANYLFKFGFNSYQQFGKLAKPIKEPIFLSSQNKFEILFVKEGPYWQGTTLHFSGANATFFYRLIQEGIISWEVFSSGVLCRFDLYFSRKNKIEDKISVREFFDNCKTKLAQTNKNISSEKNSKGLILKLGSRRSNHFSRIYQTNHFLRFEHEMKGKFLQNYHLLLVANNFEEFEHNLSKYFFSYFGKLLPLNYSYVDWLLTKLRPIRKQQIPRFFFNSDYIESNSLSLLADRKKFIMLMQFLVYAQQLDFKIQYLGDTSYRQVVFQIQDFLKFQDPLVRSTNYYQLKKIIHFFLQLQTNTLVTSFTDTKFESLVSIPKVSITKSDKLKCWIGSVWVAEELFYYKYPFLLPDFFRKKTTKDQFEVGFEIIKVFSSVTIEKEFFIQEFLDNYQSVISNQRITNIKRYFIQLVKVLEDHDLIEANYKIISNGRFYHAEELNIHNISEGFVLYEKLSI